MSTIIIVKQAGELPDAERVIRVEHDAMGVLLPNAGGTVTLDEKHGSRTGLATAVSQEVYDSLDFAEVDGRKMIDFGNGFSVIVRASRVGGMSRDELDAIDWKRVAAERAARRATP